MSRLTQYSSAAVRWRAALSMSREWVVVVATSWRAAAMVAASSSRRRGRRMGVMRWLVGRSDMRGPLFEVGGTGMRLRGGWSAGLAPFASATAHLGQWDADPAWGFPDGLQVPGPTQLPHPARR